MTTVLCFWGVFRRNISLAKFARRNLSGKFAWWNLPAKFAGEIRWRKLPAKSAAELICKSFGEKTLVKPNLIFGKKPPPKKFTCKFHRSQNAPPTHPKNFAFYEVGPKETSWGQGTLCVHVLQTQVPSKRHEEGYQSWSSLFPLQSRKPSGIVTAQLH